MLSLLLINSSRIEGTTLGEVPVGLPLAADSMAIPFVVSISPTGHDLDTSQQLHFLQHRNKQNTPPLTLDLRGKVNREGSKYLK